MKDYILKSEAENDNFSDITYREMLATAKTLKGKEKRQAELEKQKAEEEKVIQQKTVLLCSKKWKMENRKCRICRGKIG